MPGRARGGGGWLGLAWGLARRERDGWRDALARAARAFYPLIALLLIPAHHWLGLRLTLGPVFLLVACGAMCAAVAVWLLRPRLDGRAARILFSTGGAWGLSAAYIAVFSTLFLLQYHALHLGFADSGSFAEAVGHASRGGPLRSNWQASGVIFELHPTLVLVPISYLYRLWPRHELLLVLQSAGLGLGGVAAYLLGKAVLRDRFAAWCLAAAYLLAPTTAFVNLPLSYGFRPMALLPPALLWALCFLERRQMPWYWLFAFLALYIKETAAPVLVMLAVVGHVLAHPLDTLGYVLGQRVKVFFLLHLLVPVLGACLLSPLASLTWAASFATLALSHYYGKYIILIGAPPPAPLAALRARPRPRRVPALPARGGGRPARGLPA